MDTTLASQLKTQRNFLQLQLQSIDFLLGAPKKEKTEKPRKAGKKPAKPISAKKPRKGTTKINTTVKTVMENPGLPAKDLLAKLNSDGADVTGPHLQVMLYHLVSENRLTRTGERGAFRYYAPANQSVA